MQYPAKTMDFQTSVLPDGRWLLFSAQQNQMQTLSAPVGILWELCDGETTVEALIAEMCEYYADVEPSQMADQVTAMLGQLAEQGLISDGNA